jgi:hypothetical protein
MATKRFPRTIDEYLESLRKAKEKAASIPHVEDLAFDEDTLNHLNTFFPLFEASKSSLKTALAKQTAATKAKAEAFDWVAIFISHYFQSFNNGIVRKLFKDTDRPFYGLDVNDSRVPNLFSEADLSKWAGEIKSGEAARVANGGAPMAMPTAAQVEAEYQKYAALKITQTGLKDAYDVGQENLHDMLREARTLVQDIQDAVEYKFRREEISSLRRKAREYGIVYIDDNGEVISDEPAAPLTGTVAPKTSATIMKGGYDINSLFKVTNKGPVLLKLYSAANAGDAVPSTTVDIAPGQQLDVWATELGAESNTFFMVYNPDETVAGSWEVEVGE